MKKNKKDSVRYSDGPIYKISKEARDEIITISDTSEAEQAMEKISESFGENIENCFNDIINIANLSISTRDANEINEKRLSKIENLKLGARVCDFLEGVGVKLVFTGGAASIITIGVNAYMDKSLVQNLMLSACVVAFGSAMSYMSSKLKLKKEEKILLLENKKEIVAGFIENVSTKNLDEDIRRVKMKYIEYNLYNK